MNLENIGPELILATSNVHKVTELRKMLPRSFRVRSLSDLGQVPEIPETGETFTENALIKARFVSKLYNVNALADDSGLEVEALGGAPGIYSARYAGENAGSADNIRKLLNALKNVTNRNASFKAVIVLVMNGDEHVFEGECKGEIAPEPDGEGGFGYDPVFIPQGYNRTFAELGPEVKDRISHRAVAMRKLVGFLENL